MENLDPSIVNLVKSIGQKESDGNYQAKGGSREYGAYQMTPGFVKTYAPKYLKDYQGSELSPAQQDELAYRVVEDWGKQGLSPAQIASKWNSGDENAYLDPTHKGVNSFGVNYDTPQYVQDVQNIYDQMSGAQSKIPTQTNSTSDKKNKDPSLLDWITGIGSAGLGWLASNFDEAAGPIAGTATSAGLLAMTKSPTISLAGGQAASNLVGGLLGDKETPQVSELNQASQQLTSQIVQDLERTPTGRKYLQDDNAKEGISFMGMFGYQPQVDKNGNADWSSAINKNNQVLGNTSREVEDMLKDEEKTGNYEDWAKDAKEKMKQRVPEYDWDAADAFIDKIKSSYEKGGAASLDRFQKIKYETGHGRKFDALESSYQREAYKAMSLAAREQITKNTSNPDLYNAAMKFEQNSIKARNIMKFLNSKKTTTNKSAWKEFAHLTGNAAAAYIGNKIGGPVGAILAYVIENKAAKIIDKKFGKTSWVTKGMQKAISKLEKNSPEAYKILVQELKKQHSSIEELTDTEKKHKTELEKLQEERSILPEKEEQKVQKTIKKTYQKGMIK